MLGLLIRFPQLRWQIRLRITEYLTDSPLRSRKLVGLAMQWRLQARAVRLGYSIPLHVCGPGLKLPHWGTIVISGRCQIGAGATIHPGTCLGEHYSKAPQVGAQVYLGPGAKAYGGITIGDGAALGANSVTNRDVPAGAVMIGIPSLPTKNSVPTSNSASDR